MIAGRNTLSPVRHEVGVMAKTASPVRNVRATTENEREPHRRDAAGGEAPILFLRA
jgi:hypothetical protein